MLYSGSITIRRKTDEKDEVFIFEIRNDKKRFASRFRETHKKPESVDELILDVLREAPDNLVAWVEEYDPDKNYKALTVYAEYYNGRKWVNDKKEVF